MTRDRALGTTPLPADLLSAVGPVLGIVGAYGSGKTEVSVNLALGLAAAGRAVQIADLDLVNPYFRCREARAPLEAAGVRVVVPPGQFAFADLPIVLPEIAGMLQPPPGTTSLFDVGGDDVGARALAAFRPRLGEGDYELWQVINARRPFSDDVAACARMRAAIEGASRLRVTGLLANTHLVHETDADVVLEGLALARAVSADAGLPLRAVCVMGELADAPALAGLDVPVLELGRRMLPPWLRFGDGAAARSPVRAPDDLHRSSAAGPARPQAPLPAARARPIGLPDNPTFPPPTRGPRHG